MEETLKSFLNYWKREQDGHLSDWQIIKDYMMYSDLERVRQYRNEMKGAERAGFWAGVFSMVFILIIVILAV